jgi:hypothetical protein
VTLVRLKRGAGLVILVDPLHVLFGCPACPYGDWGASLVYYSMEPCLIVLFCFLWSLYGNLGIEVLCKLEKRN